VKRQYLIINSVIFGVILGASGATWLAPTPSIKAPLGLASSPAPDRDPLQTRTNAAPLTTVTSATIPHLKPTVSRRVLTVHKNDTLQGLLTSAGVTHKNAYRAIAALSKNSNHVISKSDRRLSFP